MKLSLTGILLAFALAAGAATAAAPVPAKDASEKDAIAMAERGAAYIKANGREALVKRITEKDPSFVQGENYIYMRDFTTGANIAHPYNQTIVGKNLDEVPDNNGKLYRREIWDIARKEGHGWVDYVYKNPTSGKAEAKTVYLLRVGDAVLVAGIYKK